LTSEELQYHLHIFAHIVAVYVAYLLGYYHWYYYTKISFRPPCIHHVSKSKPALLQWLFFMYLPGRIWIHLQILCVLYTFKYTSEVILWRYCFIKKMRWKDGNRIYEITSCSWESSSFVRKRQILFLLVFCCLTFQILNIMYLSSVHNSSDLKLHVVDMSTTESQ